MCGITAWFCRESVPNYEYLDILFQKTEERGKDGFGFITIQQTHETPNQRIIQYHEQYSKPYSQVKNEVKKILTHPEFGLKVGDLVIAISRAQPETECNTDENDLTRTMQPIVSYQHGVAVVHNGAVSNFVYNDIKKKTEKTFDWLTDIDSEAILASYIYHERNIKNTFEYLSGGFAVIMYDVSKDMLYVINDFKPIAHGYIKGLGFVLHSDVNAIREIIEKHTGCNKDGVFLWESWYAHYLSGAIREIDLQSGFMAKEKYSPRYVTQKWDSNFGIKYDLDFSAESFKSGKIDSQLMAIETDKKMLSDINEDICLVSASGGLDSSTTLCVLKAAGYKNIHACHFRYGHRGQDAETIAIENVCRELNVTLKIFDIESLMKSIDTSSMLIDPNAKITTGTKEGLKRLDAWVNMRNTQFLTWMATYAESQVMKYDIKKVYLLGGFLNLSESGHYPDNSEYFLQTYLEHLKYGSLIGNRVQPLYCLSNLMKHELFVLIKHFGWENVYKHTISCDRPIVKIVDHEGQEMSNEYAQEWQDDINDVVACNCSKDGIPACGSGLLSYWASKMVGLDDMKIRNFYDVKDDDYQAHIPGHISRGFTKSPKIEDVIDRIILPKEKIENLKKLLKEK